MALYKFRIIIIIFLIFIINYCHCRLVKLDDSLSRLHSVMIM